MADRYNWIMDPNAPWNQIMNPAWLDKWKQEQTDELMRRYQQALGQGAEALQENVGNAWWGTGAGGLGIQSSIPTQMYNKYYQQMQSKLGSDVLQPGLADIASRYVQARQQAQTAGQQMLYEAMLRKAEQERSKKRAILSAVGGLIGGSVGLLGGPFSAAAGAGLGSQIFGSFAGGGGGEINPESYYNLLNLIGNKGDNNQDLFKKWLQQQMYSSYPTPGSGSYGPYPSELYGW